MTGNPLFGSAADWERWKNIGGQTWDSVPEGGFSVCVGPYAGWHLTTGSFNIFHGAGVGSDVTDESNLVIIALPNGRLFRADLKAETAEFLDYSDDAARVAPEIRTRLA